MDTGRASSRANIAASFGYLELVPGGSCLDNFSFLMRAGNNSPPQLPVLNLVIFLTFSISTTSYYKLPISSRHHRSHPARFLYVNFGSRNMAPQIGKGSKVGNGSKISHGSKISNGSKEAHSGKIDFMSLATELHHRIVAVTDNRTFLSLTSVNHYFQQFKNIELMGIVRVLRTRRCLPRILRPRFPYLRKWTCNTCWVDFKKWQLFEGLGYAHLRS